MPPMLMPTVIGSVFALLGCAWWPLVVMRGDPWLRDRVSRHFGVTITLGARGHWRIERGGVRGFLIEMLQFTVYMAAFVVWACWMGLGLAIIYVVQP